MKSGSSNVSSANLAGIRRRDGLKRSRFGLSRDHATIVRETFHTVSSAPFLKGGKQKIVDDADAVSADDPKPTVSPEG
jgi:hypothetical protein